MQSASGRRWRLREYFPTNAEALVSEGGITPLQARLLASRGISSWHEAKQFLSSSLSGLSDPFLLKGMSEAVNRLVQARGKGEAVCVHGDYDVDGVTAVALLVSFFRAVGMPVFYVIPLRLEEGYGLSRDGVDEAVRLGAKVLITVDCGITSVAEAE
jgi:single-stranded-DNA-specific exonuclease